MMNYRKVRYFSSRMWFVSARHFLQLNSVVWNLSSTQCIISVSFNQSRNQHNQSFHSQWPSVSSPSSEEGQKLAAYCNWIAPMIQNIETVIQKCNKIFKRFAVFKIRACLIAVTLTPILSRKLVIVASSGFKKPRCFCRSDKFLSL